MTTDASTQEAARQALYEMQRYLADEIAPMMAVEAANIMLRMPPKYGAAAIRQWVESQLTAPGQAVNIAGFLYHAVKKFHQLSEFQLVSTSAMDHYLTELSRLVIQLCPEREQTEFRLKLSRIGEVKTTLSEPIKLLNRELGSEDQEEQLERILAQQKKQEQAQQASSPEDARIVVPSPRLAMMMGRLQETGAQQAGDVAAQELIAPLLTKAVVESQNAAQLRGTLENLHQNGVEAGFDQMFRLLGRSLPGWSLDPDSIPSGLEVPHGSSLEAMHKIVALAGTREEGGARFGEMVYAAIEQFNDGHLAQAVAMFDVAQRLIEENKVDTTDVDAVRASAQGSVSSGALRKFTSVTTKHGLLRKVLQFFPILRPEQVLACLDGEPRREQRKLMLSLLEVHGPPCRPKLIERLGGYRSGKLLDPDGFYSRNVVFLLRRIPRRPDDDQAQEFELLSEFSHPGQPFMVTKEAVGALANLTIPQAEQRLIQRLTGFEEEASSGDSPYTIEEALEMLDRICASLVRVGTPTALLSVIDHGFRKEPSFGDALNRLVYLSTVDLSEHRELLQRVIRAVREMLPTKFLGVVVGRRDREITQLFRVLSGTHEPSVVGWFEEIVERFPSQEFAEQARETLSKLQSGPAAEEAGPTELSGDLELFGLPTLFQSLADSKASGRLLIFDSNGHDRAAMAFNEGRIVHCSLGRLRGLDAVCQLFERPEAGSFRFEKPSPQDTTPRSGESMEVMPTILEAVRRDDEFQEDRALVPDGTSLMSTGTRPTPPEGESNRPFVEAVWREAARGTAPESCEGTMGADAYRVRRLYAHWLEKGALKPRPA